MEAGAGHRGFASPLPCSWLGHRVTSNGEEPPRHTCTPHLPPRGLQVSGVPGPTLQGPAEKEPF